MAYIFYKAAKGLILIVFKSLLFSGTEDQKKKNQAKAEKLLNEVDILKAS